MHARKKHSRNTYDLKKRSQLRRKQRNRKIRQLCIKCTLCASTFLLTLLAAAEWDILKPQSDSWKYSSTKPAMQADDADRQMHGSDSDRGGQAQASDSGTDGRVHGPNADMDGQVELSDSDTDRQVHSSSPDNQTSFSDVNNQIYYTDSDNQLQFSANAGEYSLIQSVPEHPQTEQLIDTTVDDGETPHFTQVSSDWNLILVNPWNEMPEHYDVNLTRLPNGHSIDSRCYTALTEMLNACRNAGLYPLICSSYRSQQKQESLFQERIDELIWQGYSKKDAKAKAATSVARPGTSEHQVGLAVDLVDRSYQALDARQEFTPVQQWLMENSWKYGFILRYPNNKSNLTGIIYEPWHYRYVGTEAAKEIYERGICLEEYLEGQ